MNDNKKKRYFRINEITEWDVNWRVAQSYADRNKTTLEYALWEAQVVARNYLEDGEGMELPWVVEAASEDEALAKYSEEFYEAFSLAIPSKAKIDEVHKFEVSVQVDCRADVEVYGKDFDEARERAQYADFDLNTCDIIETHPVNATDTATGEFRDLY